MLTHKGTKTLQTKRLTLRRFTAEDATPMFENWANDTRVTRYLTWPAHTSPAFTKQLLESWCSEYEKPDFYNWVICLDNLPIGNISAVEISERDEAAALGYCIGTAYWRKGIMPEAVRAVCSYLFEEIGVNRIEISHAVKNPASGRVAQKCGFTFEGTKREFFKTADGEFLDISFHSLLKSEWCAKGNEEKAE